MKKRAEEIEVSVDNDRILIHQPDPLGDDERNQTIVVSPDQVVLLIEWLREARDKIRGTETKNG
jgi:hypothetical protein